MSPSVPSSSSAPALPTLWSFQARAAPHEVLGGLLLSGRHGQVQRSGSALTGHVDRDAALDAPYRISQSVVLVIDFRYANRVVCQCNARHELMLIIRRLVPRRSLIRAGGCRPIMRGAARQ